MDFVDPLLADRTRGLAAFAAYDRPMNAAEIDGTDRSDQRLERDEADRSRRFAQMLDATHDIGILDAGAEPNIGQDFPDLSGNEFCHALGRFGEDLIIVPRRVAHHLPDAEG